MKGVVGDDDVTASFPSSGSFQTVNAGNNIVVSYGSIALGGADSNNYTVEKPTLTANITPASVSVTADNKIKSIGDDDPPLTYTFKVGNRTTLYGNDVFTGELTRDQGDTIGFYNITQGTLAINENYSISYIPGVFIIRDGLDSDVNNDGNTDVLDLIQLNEYISTLITFTPEQIAAWDANSDFNIYKNDILAFQVLILNG